MTTTSLKSLKIAQTAIGSSLSEQIEALISIRTCIIEDTTINGTEARNRYPALAAVLESMRIEPPSLEDFAGNDAGKWSGASTASNSMGLIASLGRHLSELQERGLSEQEIAADSDIKVFICQLQMLAGI